MNEEHKKTPTGAEFRARRERLGLSKAWIEHVLDGLDVGVGAYKGDGTNGQNRRMVAEGDPDGDDVYDPDEMEEIRATYAAALTAEEQRQAREALADLTDTPRRPHLYGRSGKAWGTVISRRFPREYDAWGRDREPGKPSFDAILAALREAAGEPAQVVGVDMASEPDRTVVTAAPPTEPVAPEGVTVAVVNGKHDVKLNGVLCFRVDTWGVCDCHTDVVPVMSGQHWPVRLVRYAADLAEWCAHAAGEQQRRLDAVRAAEEAVDKARRAEDEAASERCIAENNYEIAKGALANAQHVLAAAKREAGIA